MNIPAYFAMPVTYYDDPNLKQDVKLLEELGYTPYVPNSPEDDAGYKAHGMKYFTDLIEKKGFGALFFRSFANGLIGAGVANEIGVAFNLNIPVLEVVNDWNPRILGYHELGRREMTRSQTRHFIGVIKNISDFDGLGTITL